MNFHSLILLAWIGLAVTARTEVTNLVANGSFERSQNKPGAPDFWSCAGNPVIRQQLLLDTGRDGQRCAKLECTAYSGDGPDYHVMLCQAGKVSVRRGQWYKLSFWAKGRGLKAGSVDIGLSNTRDWNNTGLAEAFEVNSEWEQHECRFQARSDLPASASRLQFWFKGTGTLWLDDVELIESSENIQWFPQIATENVKNFVPNSSFECGAANWGSFTYGLSGWAGNLYRLEGELDDTVIQHGKSSLKIALTPATLPVFYFDYYEPVRQPIRRVLAANQGWFRVVPGQKLTLSAYLRADAEGVIAQLAANEAPNHLLRQQVTVGPRWQRQQFTFTPSQPYLFIAVGLDLEASRRDAATLWVDAIQLERGNQATAYEPRQPVESFIETAVPGNIFTNLDAGATFEVRAYNDSDRDQSLPGRLALTDFFDKTVLERPASLTLPLHSPARLPFNQLCPGRYGFFRATWTTGTNTHSIRSAIIKPVPPSATDSPFGFNHAYPWDFLVRQARTAGIVWWRDWSAKWQTVEPHRGQFDFQRADEQIDRVLALDSEVEVLLPFPSASWSTTARADDVAKTAGNDAYLRARLPMAFAPRDLNDFGHYAAQTARHYGQGHPRRVHTYQILNEPVYTSYALPRQFGYGLNDYLPLLGVAYRALKTADPQCRVVGGISAGPESGLTLDLVSQGGLQSLDILDLHLYDPPRRAESYEEAWAALDGLIRQHGGPKPIWITEWGCYADDDPPSLPHSVGDASMNRSRWPNERAATEHIVKFATVGFAYGLRKIFFHAGTCGPINGPDAGGVLFEYGGAPRKVYAGIAAFTSLLGVPREFLQKVDRDGLRAFLFRAENRAVAVAWCSDGPSQSLSIPNNSPVRAYDMMGNTIAVRPLPITGSPVYLVSPEPADLAALFRSPTAP